MLVSQSVALRNKMMKIIDRWPVVLIIFGVALTLVWLVLLILCLAYPRVKELVLVDKCLDSGGTWSAKYFECKK